MLTEPHGASTASSGHHLNPRESKLRHIDTRITPCPACGYHIAALFYDEGRQPFNCEFDNRNVPHASQPGRMFNHGAGWIEFLSQTRAEMLARLPVNPTVVEIGHGDGAFLEALAAARPGGCYIGFDPAREGGKRDRRRPIPQRAVFSPTAPGRSQA